MDIVFGGLEGVKNMGEDGLVEDADKGFILREKPFTFTTKRDEDIHLNGRWLGDFRWDMSRYKAPATSYN
jgi:hypothetical protein